MPASCNNAFQATPNGHNAWHWLKVKKVRSVLTWERFSTKISRPIVKRGVARKRTWRGFLNYFLLHLKCFLTGLVRNVEKGDQLKSVYFWKTLKIYDKREALFCSQHWVVFPSFLFSRQVLASTAVRGILLGLGLAISLLVFMTSNWIVGLLCGAIISCITVGVVGVIPLAGWKLGVLESLNLTLVVGLAVDYVVHLADGYVRSQKQSRRDKVRETLSHVGISVLSGASTTLGASVFMLAAKILFFFQFGIFMFCTIGLSIIYALILFTTILGIFGPEGNTGSLEPFYDWCKRKVGEPVEEEIPCEEMAGPSCRSPSESPTIKATLLWQLLNTWLRKIFFRTGAVSWSLKSCLALVKKSS